MTHIIQHDNPNLVLLNSTTAVYFTGREDFQVDDTIILQNGRNEQKFTVEVIHFPHAVKKNTVMLNLKREEL